MIQLSAINVFYNEIPVLKNVSISIKNKGFLAIIGPNGGGKTTLLKVMLGLIRPRSGLVSYESPVEAVSDIGYVPQVSLSDREFPINVMDTVLLGLLGERPAMRPFTQSEKKYAMEALEQVQMSDYKHRQIGQLSEGQRQRVLIARALITNPKLLLLDEPTASVDPNIQQNIYSLLNELKKSIQIVLVTHDVGAISSYVDEVACLNQQLHYHGSPELSNEIIEKTYCCNVDLISHGHPHRVLAHHHDS